MTQKRNKNGYFFKILLMIVYVVVGNLRNSTISFQYFDKISQLVQLTSLCLLLVLCIMDIINKRVNIKWKEAFLFVFAIINLIASKHTFVLGFSIFYLAFQSLPKKKAVLHLNIAIISSMLFIVFLSSIGIIENITSYRSDGSIRYQMGYQTSTLPNTIIFFTFINFVFVYEEKISLLFIFIYDFVAFLLYLQTDTRTGFYLVIAMSIIILLLRIKEIRKFLVSLCSNKLTKLLIYLFPLFVLILEFYLVYYYSKFTPLSFKLNELFSTRLSNSLFLFTEYGVSFFGQNIPSTLETGEYMGCDICYLYYLLNNGIIFLLIAIYINTYQIKYAVLNKKIVLLLCLLIVIIDGFVEPYLFDYKYQFFAFIVPIGNMQKEEKNERKEIQLCQRELHNI